MTVGTGVAAAFGAGLAVLLAGRGVFGAVLGVTEACRPRRFLGAASVAPKARRPAMREAARILQANEDQQQLQLLRSS